MNITFATNDNDWEGLYIDGKLVAEDHVLSALTVLHVLGHYTERVLCDYNWLADLGNLPENLEDVEQDE